eukprot:TRINITY_DN4898_c1_g1_i1.p1 TRINITY_DN4898_c1_g1~~TRINITY_DN4898_c1_g1_i1.p1  ORF type:complete len:482 (+),score=101.22 TRINITY_DN4898_c1_g1_i1:85-1530(+)
MQRSISCFTCASKSTQASYSSAKSNDVKFERIEPWKSSPTANKHVSESKIRWQNSVYCKQFFEILFKRLNFTKWEDWYTINRRVIHQHGGAQLLRYYRDSHVSALLALFPEHPWKIWRFDSVPNGYWSDRKNHRAFMEDLLLRELNLKDQEEWYQVSERDIFNFGGIGMLEYYDNSPIMALTKIFPEHKWQLWKFPRAAQKYWKDPTMQKEYMDWLFKELSLRSMEDWYQVQEQDFIQHHGFGILNLHNNSRFKALQSVYPEYDWKIWRFRVPPEYWEDENNVKSFLDWIKDRFQIRSDSDWSTVTAANFKSLGGTNLLSKYGGLEQLLDKFFPEWRRENLANTTEEMTDSSKGQRHLFRVLSELIREETFIFEVKEDHKEELFMNFIHPHVSFPSSSKNIELDIFVPSLSIAFEYQGKQHFQRSGSFGVANQPPKDEQKALLCKKAGITLITVPYWWDGSKESLVTLVVQNCPEIVSPTS